jgi:Chlorophyll A-B binding protein
MDPFQNILPHLCIRVYDRSLTPTMVSAASVLHTAFISSSSSSLFGSCNTHRITTWIAALTQTTSPPLRTVPVTSSNWNPSIQSDTTHSTNRHNRRIAFTWLHASQQEQEPSLEDNLEPNDNDDDEELEFLRKELLHLESLEDILKELETYDNDFYMDNDDDDGNIGYDNDDSLVIWDERSLEEIFGSLPVRVEEGNDDADMDDDDDDAETTTTTKTPEYDAFYNDLEQVLLQGVVPVRAGVGSECLPGDFGFDPLHLADQDLFLPAQEFVLRLVPSSSSSSSSSISATDDRTKTQSDLQPQQRPKALILRDYREAEIRHGRLAMLAAMIWPIQEMVDRFVLPDEQFGPLLYGPVTLPYFPLVMTAIMLLLGYLDIYSQAIKDMDQIGEAFLPGDCFWDPLQMLQGAPIQMKRNMQERELFNGRAAMLAVASYILEEAVTHKALFEIGSNALLLQPAYEVPFIQRWLDEQFSFSSVESDSMFIPTDFVLDSIDTFVQTTLLLMP